MRWKRRLEQRRKFHEKNSDCFGVAALGAASVAAPSSAEARGFGRGIGLGIAAGALTAGVVGAYGPGYYGYGPAYAGYYGPGYGYYAPRYYRPAYAITVRPITPVGTGAVIGNGDCRAKPPLRPVSRPA